MGRSYSITGGNVNEHSSSLLNNGSEECLLLIHSPSCGHCKAMEPEWKKLEDKINTIPEEIIIISIEGEHIDKFNPKFSVNGYPSIFYLNKDGSVKKNYSGDRSMDDLFNFLIEQRGGNENMSGGGRKLKKRKSKKRKSKKRKSKKRKSKRRKTKRRNSKRY